MLNVVILAAGDGTRMKSKYSKVVHKVAGEPIISWWASVAEKIADGGDIITVIGNCGDEVRGILSERTQYVEQSKCLGTWHACMQTLDLLRNETTLVLNGDAPLITEETLKKALELHNEIKSSVTVLTANVRQAEGYGRIIRDGSQILKIVEENDANEEEKRIKEVNSGIYFFHTKFLKSLKDKIKPHNAQGEFYLTDSVEVALSEGKMVAPFLIENEREILGVNDRRQLSHAEKILRRRIIRQHMENGVTFIDPKTTYIGRNVQIGMDTIIYPNTIIEGNTKIGADCVVIGGRIVDSEIAAGSKIEQSVIIEANIGFNANIGPFAYLRPGTVLGNGNKVGSFAEVKNSVIGNGTKIPHLSYVGDSDVGERVNFGCGSIIANYDGKKKYRSKVGNEAFIGSNVNLISPVEVGDRAFIAAGTTVTKNVPGEALAIGRVRQEVKEGWNQ